MKECYHVSAYTTESCVTLNAAHCTATYLFLYLSERAFQKSISSSLEANFGIIFASMTDKPARLYKAPALFSIQK